MIGGNFANYMLKCISQIYLLHFAPLYHKMRERLLQSDTVISSKNSTNVCYKMRQIFCYKRGKFYYKMRQLYNKMQQFYNKM